MKLGYTILYVPDMAQAVAFYRDKLGLTPTYESDDWTAFDAGGHTLALHASEAQGQTQRAGLFFVVDDVDAAYERLKQKGVEFLTEPQDQPFGFRTVECKDPFGNVVELGTPLD